MRHWHRCKRWWDQQLRCPISSRAVHKEIADRGWTPPKWATVASRLNKEQQRNYPGPDAMTEAFWNPGPGEAEHIPEPPPGIPPWVPYRPVPPGIPPPGQPPRPAPYRVPVKAQVTEPAKKRALEDATRRVLEQQRGGVRNWVPTQEQVAQLFPADPRRVQSPQPRVAYSNEQAQAAVTETAAAQATRQTLSDTAARNRGISKRRVAGAVAIGAGAAAGVAALRSTRGGGGGFQRNMSIRMKALTGQPGGRFMIR